MHNLPFPLLAETVGERFAGAGMTVLIGLEMCIRDSDKVLLSWGDTYHLHIEDGWGDPAFLCALVAAIDNCIHNEK